VVCRPYRIARPVAVGRVEIGVANAASLGFHQNSAGSWRGNVPFPKLQRFSELKECSLITQPVGCGFCKRGIWITMSQSGNSSTRCWNRPTGASAVFSDRARNKEKARQLIAAHLARGAPPNKNNRTLKMSELVGLWFVGQHGSRWSERVRPSHSRSSECSRKGNIHNWGIAHGPWAATEVLRWPLSIQ